LPRSPLAPLCLAFRLVVSLLLIEAPTPVLPQDAARGTLGLLNETPLDGNLVLSLVE
jgi:hypothetical protein